MKVILSEDVVGLGDIGEAVTVKGGYARNYLIPRGYAIEAESSSARETAHKVRQIEAKKKRLKASADDLGAKLKQLSVEVGLRVGSSGKVFGSVHARDISAKLAELGFAIDRRRIVLEEPLKKVGVHYVRVKLHPEVHIQLKVNVEKVAVSKEEEEAAVASAKASLEAKHNEEEAEPAPEEAQSKEE